MDNCAAVAGPPSPAKPWTPVPATVVIVPDGDTLRMRWLFESGMRKPPSPVDTTPLGMLIAAAVAGPPSPPYPCVPLPATVVIVPFGHTRLMRLLSSSARMKPPSGIADALCTKFSCADVAGPPSPLNPATPVPATVVIRPSPQTRRIALL